MEETVERKFGEIELKLLRAKILEDVEKILRQVAKTDENFLYPVLDFNIPGDRMIAMNPLIEGEFMGHLYEICTNGRHPIAYVSCGCLATYEKKGDYDDLPVHGGCTFAGTRLSGDGLWVGWDYGHNGDFMKPISAEPDAAVYFRYGKKWTVLEVMQDVIRAILSIEENK